MNRAAATPSTMRWSEDSVKFAIGRSTIWLHPSIPLRFVFDEPEPPPLSRTWIEELAHSANSSGGIALVDEHIENPPPED